MTKVSELQAILLTTASRRPDLSLLPYPATLSNVGARLTKALAALVKHGLAAERETSDSHAVHRDEGDRHFGLFVTPAGLAAIGVEPAPGREPEAADPVAAPPAARQPRATKAALVVSLLERDGGATLAQLIAATDWLPHTVRAALTGLRKKGHTVERDRRDGATGYRIVGGAR